jgi:hypothetical protein
LSGLGTLFVGIAAIISSLVSAGALLVSVRRGSNRENQRAAEVAVQVVQNASSPEGDSNVVVIDPKERGVNGH